MIRQTYQGLHENFENPDALKIFFIARKKFLGGCFIRAFTLTLIRGMHSPGYLDCMKLHIADWEAS